MGASPEPLSGRVAMCGPGMRGYAAVLLLLRGEQVTAIREHPWLGPDDVWIIDYDAAASADPPFPFLYPDGL